MNRSDLSFFKAFAASIVLSAVVALVSDAIGEAHAQRWLADPATYHTTA